MAQPKTVQLGPIRTVDMHTGGEPVRIIVDGYPPVHGDTILQKRRYAREKLDAYRTLLMFEPRGHFDMYGALLVEPSLPQADLAVLFMHNEGYSTMCGHAVIALGRYVVDEGLVPITDEQTKVVIECPCGLVTAYVDTSGGRASAVAFDSVPAFLLSAGLELDVPGHGKVACDIAYGGAFYAIADASAFGLSLADTPVETLTAAAHALTQVAQKEVPLSHPDDSDLAFLYGTILTDGQDDGAASRNMCVFADAQVDRSPTGSGVTARMALRHAKGLAKRGEPAQFESIAGSAFTGEIVEEVRCGPHDAVTVRVRGEAHYAARSEFILEPDDPFPQGFLLR